MKIGEKLEWNETVYEVTKKIDEYTYEIYDAVNDVRSLYAVGRPIHINPKEVIL